MALENYPKAQQLLEALRAAGWGLESTQIEDWVIAWLKPAGATDTEVPLDLGRVAADADTVTRVVFDALDMQLFAEVFHLQRARAALSALGDGQFELEVAESFGLLDGPTQINDLVDIATTLRASLYELIFQEPPPPASRSNPRGMA